jgi:alanyl-tRNA synthetase
MVIKMVVHNHSEPENKKEAISRIMAYWKQPTQYEFSSDIIEIEGEWIRLKKSFFYEEGGGQPPDQGFLIVKNQKFAVVDVQKKKNDSWLRVPNHRLTLGQEVLGKIDSQRRETLSRNHSSQHLISATFWEESELDTKSADIGMLETTITLDQTPSLAQVGQAFQSATTLIHEKLPIESRYVSKDELGEYKIRGSTEVDGDVYRVVEIGIYDKNLCGGTHIENTEQIGALAIRKIDGRKIRFITGTDATKFLNHQSMDMVEISRIVGASLKDTKAKVENLVAERTAMERKMYKLQRNLIKQTIISAQWNSVSDYQFKFIEIEIFDKVSILDATGDVSTHQAVCTISQDGLFLITSGSEKLTNHIMKTFSSQGIKGGGKGKTAMGRSENPEILHDALRSALKSTG